MITMAGFVVLMIILWLFATIVSVFIMNFFIMGSYKLHISMDEMLILMLKGQLRDYERMEATRSLMNLIMDLATHAAILDFQVFVDTHHMDKVTRANVKELVAQVAKRVRDAIDFEKIKETDTCFKEEFYESYIVDVSTKIVKDLLAKQVINYIEEEG